MLREAAAKILNYNPIKGLHEKDKPECMLKYIYFSEFKIHQDEKVFIKMLTQVLSKQYYCLCQEREHSGHR